MMYANEQGCWYDASARDLVNASSKLDARPDLAEETTMFLRNMHGLNMSIVQQLSPVLEQQQGIDLRLYYILHVIEGGAVHPGAIAQEMKLPNSLVTKHLDQLAERALLLRSIDPHDSRRIRVSLTPRGQEIMKVSDDVLAEMVGRRLARIPDDRRASFLATLIELATYTEPK
jgi:DNA-binding MarR family transcriptional regulator